MQIISQLIRIINPRQLSLQQVLSSQTSAKSKMGRLYKGIYANEIATDEAAIEQLYKNNKNAKGSYRSLKYELRKKLFNNILLYEFSNKSNPELDRKKTFFECQKTYTIAYFLILLNARNIAIPLLEEKLPIMKKYEFTNLVIESLKILRQHASIIEGNYEDILEYNDTLEKWLRLQTIETKVDGLYYLLMANFSRKSADKKFIYSLAKSHHNAIKHSIPTEPSTSLIFKSRMIEIIMYECVDDFEAINNICSSSVLQLRNKPVPNRSSIFMLYLQWINSMFQLNKLDEIEYVMKDMLAYTSTADFNWFVAKKLMYKAAVYNRNYEDAVEIYRSVVQHEKELKRYQLLEEDWKIIALSLKVVITARAINGAHTPNLRIRKIVNEINVAKQDKKGKYASVHVFQLVHLLLEKKYEEAEKYSAAIRQYQRRYLNENEHTRINELIRIINGLLRYQADKNKDKLNSWLEESVKDFLQTEVKHKSVEIIPYEQLLAWVLDSFGQKDFVFASSPSWQRSA